MALVARRNTLGVGGYMRGARYAWRAGQVIGRGIKRAYNNYKSSSSNKRPRSARSRSLGNTTFQQDEKTIYVRHRAPKRVRRQHKRAFKKFLYMSDKLMGMKTAIINDQFTSGTLTPTTLADGQYIQTVTMYGCDPTGYAANADTQNGDLYWIFARENGGVPTTAAASRKLRFRSAVLDFKFHNDSTTEMLILDIYYVICRRSTTVQASSTYGSDAGAMWNSMIAVQEGSNLPNPIGNANFYGLTPFDAPGFGKYWLVKKKRRIQLSAGQWTTFQMRDPGNYVFELENVSITGAIKGVTEGIIIVASNPEITTDVVPIPGPVSYSYSCIKTYHYCEAAVSQDQVGGQLA